jgi:fatty acid desaturase
LRYRLDLPPAITEVLAVVNNAQFIIQACKGIIRSQRVRRTLMFWDVLAVLLLIFLGATFLWPWLRAHPLVFLGYWAFCGWLTILAALFAVYDMAKVRLDAKRTQEELKREYFRNAKSTSSDSSNDSHPH